MVKLLTGHINHFKGFSKPMQNLDPENDLRFGSSDLVICKNCLKLYGRLVRSSTDPATGHALISMRHQKCRCMEDEDKKNGKPPNIWPGNDFNNSVEFCYCCSKRLINSGSRFSSFFCSECLILVEEHNNKSGIIQIPMGRHSFMNNIRLELPYTEKEEKAFSSKLENFFTSIDVLREWQKLCLFENLYELGFDFSKDISLPYYDSLIKTHENEKKLLLKKMVNFFIDYKCCRIDNR